MSTPRIRSIEHDNRRRSFRVRVEGRDPTYVIPYGMAKVDGLVERVQADPETDCAGFVWTTQGGDEGGMLAEEVLWIHRDPEVRHEHILYELTVEALRRKEDQDVSIRALARMVGTSPARVQMLLRPTVYRNKSIKAMLRLLSALGAEVDVRVRDGDAVA